MITRERQEEIRRLIPSTQPGGIIAYRTDEERRFIESVIDERFPLQDYTARNLWQVLIAALGFDAINKLRLREEQTPEEWIEILCDHIMKESHDAQAVN